MLENFVHQASNPETHEAIILAATYASLPAGFYWAAWETSEYQLIPRSWQQRLLGSLARMAATFAFVALVRHIGWPVVRPTMTMLFSTNDAFTLCLFHLAISTTVSVSLLRKPTGILSGLVGVMALYVAICMPLKEDIFSWQLAAMGIFFWEIGATHVVRPKLTTCLHAHFCKCFDHDRVPSGT
jgi:hypothetical protein